MSARRLRIATDLLAIVVAISVALTLAGLTWRLMGYPGAAVGEVPMVTAQPASPAIDTQPIVALAPFGTPVAEGATGGAASGDLVLRGIMLARPAAASVAFIAVGAAEAKPFRLGEALPSGGVIEAIGLDTVTLGASGGEQVLGFPKKQAPGDAAGVNRMRSLLAPGVVGAAQSADSPLQVVRDKVADNPQGFLQSLGATPSAQGYRVGTGASASVRQAGLLPGDVIEKVNGQPVGDLDKDRKLFDDAVIAGHVRVDVLRDGRRLTLSFPLK